MGFRGWLGEVIAIRRSLHLAKKAAAMKTFLLSRGLDQIVRPQPGL